MSFLQTDIQKDSFENIFVVWSSRHNKTGKLICMILFITQTNLVQKCALLGISAHECNKEAFASKAMPTLVRINLESQM